MKIAIPRRLVRLAAERNPSIEWHYAVGALLSDLTSRKRGSAGAAMRQIADEVFGDQRILSTLYACRNFARVIGRCELGQLDGLTWKHIHYLISVRNKGFRASFIRLVKANGLSARQLEMAIQERLGRRTNGGRKLRIERLSPKAACRESTRLCKSLIARIPAWLRNSEVLRAASHNGDSDEALLLAEARESLEEARRVIDEQLRRL